MLPNPESCPIHCDLSGVKRPSLGLALLQVTKYRKEILKRRKKDLTHFIFSHGRFHFPLPATSFLGESRCMFLRTLFVLQFISKFLSLKMKWWRGKTLAFPHVLECESAYVQNWFPGNTATSTFLSVNDKEWKSQPHRRAACESVLKKKNQHNLPPQQFYL